MIRLERWNDWLLLAAIVCFVATPLGALILLIGVERPAFDELQATYDQSTSRPGHFLPAGIVSMVRIALTAAAIVLGLAFALAGSLRIPVAATLTRKLRDTAWILFCIALTACLLIQIA